MRHRHIYQTLLLLYPLEFHRRFSAEMLCVFEQRASELSANRNSANVAFLLTEFSSLVKGACLMWLSKIRTKIRTIDRSPSPAESTTPLTVAEATTQRDTAIRNMVTAIAAHDFVNARRYSDEEARLHLFCQNSHNPSS